MKRKIRHSEEKFLYLFFYLFSTTTYSATDKRLDVLSCFTQPSEVVELGSPVPGIVREVMVERSSWVEKDQLLVQLDDSVEQANLALSMAPLSFDGEIRAQKALLELHKKKRDRLQKMYDKHAISRDELEEVNANVRVTLEELGKAEHNRKIARLEQKRASVLMALRKIKSPIDGYITERWVSIGEYVREKPLLKIVQVDPLHVESVLPISMLGEVTSGQIASVRIEQTNKTIPAAVESIDPVIDPASGTFRIMLSIPNPEHEILAGLSCTVSFGEANNNIVSIE